MRAAVFEETKLTCSAGIAPNKVFDHHRRVSILRVDRSERFVDASQGKDTFLVAATAIFRCGSKICSDKNKPNGQYYLPPEREKIFNFMQTLSVRKVNLTSCENAADLICSARSLGSAESTSALSSRWEYRYGTTYSSCLYHSRLTCYRVPDLQRYLHSPGSDISLGPRTLISSQCISWHLIK